MKISFCCLFFLVTKQTKLNFDKVSPKKRKESPWSDDEDEEFTGEVSPRQGPKRQAASNVKFTFDDDDEDEDNAFSDFDDNSVK